MSQIKVSIIIPVFNTRPYLDQCLKSLCTQSLKEIEIICVDNGSTDGSYEFLLENTKYNYNMRVIRHAEGRQGEARNIGMAEARGEYIGFVDSDDFVSNIMFNRMYSTAVKENAEIVICNINNYYEKENIVHIKLPENWFVEKTFRIDEIPIFFRNLTICNKLFKRDFLIRNEIIFPQKCFHEDQFFVIMAFFVAKRITTINAPFYIYRLQRIGSVNSKNDSNGFSIFVVMRMVEISLRNRGIFNRYRSLYDEIKITRYLMLYTFLQKKYKKKYCFEMRRSYRNTKISRTLKICTPTEYRKYVAIKNYPYLICVVFFFIQEKLGKLVSMLKVREIFRQLKGK